MIDGCCYCCQISEAMVEEDDELREEERNIEEVDDQL